MKRKKNKISIYMIIGIIYVVVLLTISTAYSFLHEDLSIQTKVTIPQVGENYLVDAVLVSSSEENGIYYYQYNVVLDYTGTTPTVGWEVLVNSTYDTEVVECTNAGSCTVEGETISIKNSDSNYILSPNNSSTAFTVAIKTTDPNFSFEVLGVEYLYLYADVTFGRDQLGINEKWTLTVANIHPKVKIKSWTAVIKMPGGTRISNFDGADYSFDYSLIASRDCTITSNSGDLNPGDTNEVHMSLSFNIFSNPKVTSFVIVTEDDQEITITVNQ